MTVHVFVGGLEVEMNDVLVRELKESRDMVLNITKSILGPVVTKQEWEIAVDTNDTAASTSHAIIQTGCKRRPKSQ